MKESEIKIKISLDENKVPEQIHWTAEDAGERDQKSEAVLISLWDAEQQNSLRIDLWTKEMKVDEMKMADDMRRFCQYFAEELNIIKDVKKES